MISLLCAGSDFNGGTANDIKLATGGQLLSQGCAGAEVHIGVGKLAARVGIYIGGDVDNIADFDGSDCLHVEHGVVGSLPLLGHIHLSADVLFAHGGGGVADRRGDRRDLALRNVSGNDEFQFAGIVGISCGQVAFQNADRDAGACGGSGQGEVIGLLLAGHTGNHVKFTALVQLIDQGRAGAEVHIGVVEFVSTVRVHISGDVNRIAYFDGSDFFHVEHGVDVGDVLLGHIHLSADVLLVHGGGRVANGGRHRRRCLGGLRLIGGSSRGGRGRLGFHSRGFRGNGTRLRVFGRSNRGGGVRLRAVAGSCGVGLRLGGWIRGVRCRLGLADGHVGAVILRCKGGGNVAHQQTEHQQQRQNSGTDFVHKKCPPIKFSMGISQ